MSAADAAAPNFSLSLAAGESSCTSTPRSQIYVRRKFEPPVQRSELDAEADLDAAIIMSPAPPPGVAPSPRGRTKKIVARRLDPGAESIKLAADGVEAVLTEEAEIVPQSVVMRAEVASQPPLLDRHVLGGLHEFQATCTAREAPADAGRASHQRSVPPAGTPRRVEMLTSAVDAPADDRKQPHASFRARRAGRGVEACTLPDIEAPPHHHGSFSEAVRADGRFLARAKRGLPACLRNKQRTRAVREAATWEFWEAEWERTGAALQKCFGEKLLFHSGEEYFQRMQFLDLLEKYQPPHLCGNHLFMTGLRDCNEFHEPLGGVNYSAFPGHMPRTHDAVFSAVRVHKTLDQCALVAGATFQRAVKPESPLRQFERSVTPGSTRCPRAGAFERGSLPDSPRMVKRPFVQPTGVHQAAAERWDPTYERQMQSPMRHGEGYLSPPAFRNTPHSIRPQLGSLAREIEAGEQEAPSIFSHPHIHGTPDEIKRRLGEHRKHTVREGIVTRLPEPGAEPPLLTGLVAEAVERTYAKRRNGALELERKSTPREASHSRMKPPPPPPPLTLSADRFVFKAAPGVTQQQELRVTNQGKTALPVLFSPLGAEPKAAAKPVGSLSQGATPRGCRADAFVVTPQSATLLPGSSAVFTFSFRAAATGSSLQTWSLHVLDVEVEMAKACVSLIGHCVAEDVSALPVRRLEDELAARQTYRLCESILLTQVVAAAESEGAARVARRELPRADAGVSAAAAEAQARFEELNGHLGVPFSAGLLERLEALARDAGLEGWTGSIDELQGAFAEGDVEQRARRLFELEGLLVEANAGPRQGESGRNGRDLSVRQRVAQCCEELFDAFELLGRAATAKEDEHPQRKAKKKSGKAVTIPEGGCEAQPEPAEPSEGAESGIRFRGSLYHWSWDQKAWVTQRADGSLLSLESCASAPPPPPSSPPGTPNAEVAAAPPHTKGGRTSSRACPTPNSVAPAAKAAAQAAKAPVKGRKGTAAADAPPASPVKKVETLANVRMPHDAPIDLSQGVGRNPTEDVAALATFGNGPVFRRAMTRLARDVTDLLVDADHF